MAKPMSEKWDVAGSGPNCARCSAPIGLEVPFYSVLCLGNGSDGPEIVRKDLCPACFERAGAGPGAAEPGALAFWRTIRQPKQAPRRGYVKLDMEIVGQIFAAMPEEGGGAIEAELRYVLALMLLRRRRLELGRSERGMLEFADRRAERTYRVVDPSLSEERIAELTARLGELLWEREFSAVGEG